MYWTGRPWRRRVMARWRAANSSCMGTSVVRPLAVAHGGNSNRAGKAASRSAGRARWPARKRSDQLSAKHERSAVGSHLLVPALPLTAGCGGGVRTLATTPVVVPPAAPAVPDAAARRDAALRQFIRDRWPAPFEGPTF